MPRLASIGPGIERAQLGVRHDIQQAVFNFERTHYPGKAIDGPAIAGFQAGER
ncbi:hypothetical protein MBENS4_0539 [Novosphingobium sp. MBES04]|nr:hypothetical protein MBENS4_0539 [Novosphingobium sp. MBES04]